MYLIMGENSLLFTHSYKTFALNYISFAFYTIFQLAPLSQRVGFIAMTSTQ